MRILIITAQYHPAQTPNVYRWSAIAERWVGQGHSVHLLCTRRSDIPRKTSINGVEVYRTGHNTLLDWAFHFIGKKQGRGVAGGQKTEGYSLGRKVLEWLVDHSWRSLYWPDGSCLWYFPGKRLAKQLFQQQPYDAVVSVGLPFTAHLIAASLKQQFPGIRWLMDVEDPFSISEAFFVNNLRLYRRLNFKVEHRLLQLADVVSFTVDAARKEYLKAFPEVTTPFVVNPPVFDLNFSNSSKSLDHIFTPGFIHLTYFGAFYQKVRTPDAFLHLLRQTLQQYPELKVKLQVHFFGELSGPFAQTFSAFSDLNPCIRLHGLVPRETVARAMQSTDLLLHISNTTTYHLPSKSADYLMSGKPIVNIYYDDADTFKAFLKAYPLALHLQLDQLPTRESQVTAFLSFLQEMPGEQVKQEVIARMGANYQLPQIADAYLRMLRD